MKTTIALILLLSSFISVNAQDSEVLLDSITNKACEMIIEIEEIPKKKKEKQTLLGVVLITSCLEYKNEIQEEYGFDVTNPKGKQGNVFYEELTMSMLGVCPVELIKVIN